MKLSLCALITVLFFLPVLGEEETTPEVELPKSIAALDIKNTDDGSYPGGATPKGGKWMVDSESETLRLAPEPLDRGALEFGPEIREKPATIVATMSASGAGRLKDRVGAGLYGKNGFQLELVPITDRIELVRRGAVLASAPITLIAEAFYTVELSVIADEGDWIIEGRVWGEGAQRPGDPLIEYKAFADELLFPLAGRSRVVATPFSGESPQFRSAEVFDATSGDLE